MKGQLSAGCGPARAREGDGASVRNPPERANGHRLVICAGQAAAGAPRRPNPSWASLTQADVRSAADDAAVTARVRELVQAALDRDDRAIIKIGEIFRPAFFYNHGLVTSAVGRWWSRDELASELLEYLVVGVRPSLRAMEPGPPSAAQGSEAPAAGVPRPPLRRWLEDSPAPLAAYVWVTLARICTDLIRRAKVLGRLGATGEEGVIDQRSDADAPELPTLNRWQGSKAYAQEASIHEEQREALLAMAMQVLTRQEHDVLAAIRNDESQKDIARRLGISEGRISQIKSNAVAKLRAAMKKLEIRPEGTGK